MGFGSERAGSPTFHGPDPRSTPLAATIDERIDGSVRADTYTRHLFATDASLYRAVPVAVVFPRTADDVRSVVEVCCEREVSILPRGGGTSLAGQTVNEAVVLDCSRHLNDVIEVDRDDRLVTAQPGVVLGELNERLADDGLRFAPDPAWGNHSTLGGAIGNDSSGAHSLVYGTTRDHVHELEVVFVDGTVVRLGPTEPEAIHDEANPEGDAYERLLARVSTLITGERERIEAAYPDLHRNTAGYALDALLETDDAGRINLARLFVGSEGTLGVVTEATITVVEPPAAVGAILLSYDNHQVAMEAVPAILATEPAAIETMDEPILEIARDHPTFAEVARLPHPDASGVLLVECFGDSEAAVHEHLAHLERRFGPSEGRSIDARIATDGEERTRFWQLRKSSLPLLLSKTTDEKHVALVEDVAVPPDELASFVAGFRELLAEHDTTASFYGHAGASVLHVRPIIDTVSSGGRQTMRSVASGVFELAMAHGGSITGEHGDGRARTEWSQRQYDPAIVDQFTALKRAVDPTGLLNPGPITGDVDLTEDHRVEPDSRPEPPFEPALAWENTNGLPGMVDLCHGCGGCRGAQSTDGGIMCPTYRATHEEIAATRGRANLLREAMRGHLDPVTLFEPRFEAEVLDLCIGCKGCLRDCPSGVDMASLKAEVRHARHERRGATPRERLFGAYPRLARWGSALAPMSNWLARAPLADRVVARTLGLAPERPLPRFASTPLTASASGRVSSVRGEPRDRVLLLADPFTNYVEPEVGRATIELLEAVDVRVHVPASPPPGRTAHSQGFLERARDHAEATLELLEPYVEDGWSVVVPEPSQAAMVQSDYAKLLGADRVGDVVAATYTPMGYLDRLEAELPVVADDATYAIHEHCHQQSIGNDGSIEHVFGALGFDVTTLDSGCCGMAGSFGYEREHYELSRSIGSILVDQVEAAEPTVTLATGTSCRSQLDHLEAPCDVDHPVTRLAAHLPTD